MSNEKNFFSLENDFDKFGSKYDKNKLNISFNRSAFIFFIFVIVLFIFSLKAFYVAGKKLPENKIIPKTNNQTTILKSLVFKWKPKSDINKIPKLWNIWYKTALSYADEYSAILSFNACAPKAPIITDKAQNIIPKRIEVLNIINYSLLQYHRQD